MANRIEKLLLSLQESIAKSEAEKLVLKQKLADKDKEFKEYKKQQKSKPAPTPKPAPKPAEPVPPAVEEEEPDPDQQEQVPAEVPIVTQEPEEVILQQPPTPKPEVPVTPDKPYVRANLRSEIIFTNKDLPIGWRYQVYTDHGFSIVDFPKVGKVAKFELTPTDKKIHERGVRSEINTLKGADDNEERVGFNVYFPKEYFGVKDSKYTIFNQYHNDALPGEGALSPPIALFVQDGKIQLSVNYGTAKNKQQKRYELGPVPLDKWTAFYLYLKYSNDPTTDKNNPKCGTILVSMNGKRVVEHRGPTMYSPSRPKPYIKFGIYKRNWDKQTKKIVIYFDDIRIGKSASNWQDVNPDNK